MLFIILVLLDQITKYLIRFLGGFYICNPGISFGFIMPTTLFWLLWIILILSLLYYYLKLRITKTKYQTLPTSRQVSNKLQSQISKEQTSGFEFMYCNLKNYFEFRISNFEFKKVATNKTPLISLGLTFIISGAISNALDRLFLGCVVDFINLHIWPVFNLADIFITLGAIMIVVVVFRNKS